MTSLFGIQAVGVGIHLAVTLLLLLRYLEGRDRLIGWWSIAYLFFTAHIIAEALMIISPVESVVALRHLLFIGAAWAMVYSFRPHWGSGLLAALGSLIAISLVPVSWFAAATIASLLGGAGFITSAWLLFAREEGLQTSSVVLLFWGLLLTGVHSLDYPLLRPHPVLVAVGAAASGVFTLMFGMGMMLWALRRTRDLIIMNTIAETLNRSLDVRSALSRALSQLIDLMRLQSGWIFLRDHQGFQLMAEERLPPELAVNNMAAMHGDCRCLQMLQEGQLTQAVNVVNCLRLEKAGLSRPRHATVPLRTASGVIGLMNLILPPQRMLTSRELITLSMIGNEIGLAAERTRLYEDVREKEEVRGDLLKKLITAHEDERRRIARGLHDEAGQSLTALILNLEMAERSAPSSEKQHLARLRSIAEDTLDELRRVIYGLRPTILDDLGLTAAIRWYVKETVEPQGLHVLINLTGLKKRLPYHLETAVFRIVQEALTNVLKHANAHQAIVDVSLVDAQLRVAIGDDGQGFDVASSPRSSEGGGMGLLGMRERAELLGGSWKVQSQPGEGTQLEAVIPVEVDNGEH